MKRVITGVLAVLLAASSFAQQRLDLSERWLMNERLLDLASTYERSSRFAARSDNYTFLSLFRSPDVPVYCDYMASTEFGESIPASRYVELSKSMEDRSVQISRFKKGPFEYRDGRWHVRLEFDKRIEYEDSLGFVFSTLSPLAGGDYHLALDCVWMRDDEEFRIEKISGDEAPSFRFPRGKFHVVQQKNEIDTRVLYNGQPLTFNDYGFTVLPEGSTFDFDDDDYLLTYDVSPGGGRYDVYSFSVKAKKFRVRPRLSYTFNPLRVSMFQGPSLEDPNNYFKPLSSAVELGADIGYSFSLGRSVKLVPYIGLGLSRSWFSVNSARFSNVAEGSTKDISYIFPTRDDHPYSFSAKEVFSFTDFTVSALASFEINLSRQLTAIAELGAKAYLNISSWDKDKYTISFDDPSQYNLLEDRYLRPNTIGPNFWTLAMVGKLGAEYAVATGTYAFAHIGIEYGAGSVVMYSNDTPGVWFKEGSIYPIVPRTQNGQTEDILVHSFKNSISSIERGLGITAEVGVRLKF